jgi:hypothetical protein
MANSQSRLELSVLNLIALLAVLAVNALATTIPIGGKATAEISDMGKSSTSGAVKYFVHLPMSVYLGWITIATMAILGILIKRTADGSIAVQGVIITSIVGICLLTFAVVVQNARRKVYRSSRA